MPKATWDNLPAAKRRRVVEAAMGEFGRHGFSGGSLNVIAREAGVAKGSLFQYFHDKLELYAYVCDACSERVRDHMVGRLEAHAQLPLFDLLRAVMADWMTYFRTAELDRAVTFAANSEFDPDVRSTIRRVTNAYYVAALHPLLKVAADRGELRADADLDALLALLLLLLPHLALAPNAPDLDPVLGLAETPTDELPARIEGPGRGAGGRLRGAALTRRRVGIEVWRGSTRRGAPAAFDGGALRARSRAARRARPARGAAPPWRGAGSPRGCPGTPPARARAAHLPADRSGGPPRSGEPPRSGAPPRPVAARWPARQEPAL